MTTAERVGVGRGEVLGERAKKKVPAGVARRRRIIGQ